MAEKSADITPDIPGNPIRELADRLAEEAAKAAEYRVRLELTEQAQSTLEAQLVEERRRREEAEKERDELRRRLEAPQDRPQESESAPEPSEGAPPPRSDAVGAQEGAQEPETARRPWWLRWMGG